jgi:hypothetical protein
MTVVRVTVPVHPEMGVIVTDELPAAPVLKSAGEVVRMVNSPPNVNDAVVEWVALPGEPTALIVTPNKP